MSRPKRLLFPLGEREIEITDWRVLDFFKGLAAAGYTVDLLTYHEELTQRAGEEFKAIANLNVMRVPPEKPFWTMQLRDNFARTFIKLNYELMIPGSDFHFWKLVGFDDFLWNVAASAFPRITEKYDLIIFPIPSFHEQPSSICDVFYTNVLYYAREYGVTTLGLQIHPIYSLPPNFKYLIDQFVVTSERDRRYFNQENIADERIHLLEDIRESYAICPIEDPYRNFCLDKEIRIERDELGIVLVNTAKNRTQIHRVLEIVSQLTIAYKLFFVYVDFAVRDLHEKDVFEDLIQPVMERTVKRWYNVECGGAIKSLMLGDVMIATDYILPLSFARKYNKLGVVFNPLIKKVPEFDEVDFINDTGQLTQALEDQLARKKQVVHISDIIEKVAS